MNLIVEKASGLNIIPTRTFGRKITRKEAKASQSAFDVRMTPNKREVVSFQFGTICTSQYEVASSTHRETSTYWKGTPTKNLFVKETNNHQPVV